MAGRQAAADAAAAVHLVRGWTPQQQAAHLIQTAQAPPRPAAPARCLPPPARDHSSSYPLPSSSLQLDRQTSSNAATAALATAAQTKSPTVAAIEGQMGALLQDLDVAVAERSFSVARNTLEVRVFVGGCGAGGGGGVSRGAGALQPARRRLHAAGSWRRRRPLELARCCGCAGGGAGAGRAGPRRRHPGPRGGRCGVAVRLCRHGQHGQQRSSPGGSAAGSPGGPLSRRRPSAPTPTTNH
jgi:hypothetical protein